MVTIFIACVCRLLPVHASSLVEAEEMLSLVLAAPRSCLGNQSSLGGCPG